MTDDEEQEGAPPRETKRARKRKRRAPEPSPAPLPVRPRRETSDRGWLIFGLLPWFIVKILTGTEPPAREAAEAEAELPAFAHKFPKDAELDKLVAAFEAGDYARVRREGPVLARKTEDDAVRRAARELVRRLDPDPLAVYMLMAAVGLLVFLAGWYWLHPHTP